MDIGWDGISSYRRDAIQSPSHRTPQFAIAKAQRTQKKSNRLFFEANKFMQQNERLEEKAKK